MDADVNPVSGLEISRQDLGPSEVLRHRVSSAWIDVKGRASRVRQVLRECCPRLPGVYGMFDKNGDVLYVGMSCRLRDRLLTYFGRGRAYRKERRVAASASRVVWEITGHELTARLRELELIRRWRPRFNLVGRPGRREFGFICLGGGPAPNFGFRHQPPPHCRRWWGPLPRTQHTNVAVEQLNQLLLLPDCAEKTRTRFAQRSRPSSEHARPGCLRGHLGTCLAPCIGEFSPSDYEQEVARGCAFLDGHDRHLLEQVEAAMRAAADRGQYEQAAGHRDIWLALEAFWDRLSLLREAVRLHEGVHVLQGHSRKAWWILMAAGHAISVVRPPSSKRAARRCLELLENTFTDTAGDVPENYEQLRIVASWYRRHPGKHSAVIQPHHAAAICHRQLDDVPADGTPLL